MILSTFIEMVLKHPDGSYSLRRTISAFISFTIGPTITFLHLNDSNYLDTLVVWLTYSMSCLGIITAEQIIELKYGSNKIGTKEE